MSGEHDVELVGVVKTLGRRRVVDGVSLGVRPGELFGLLGPSGCGKSTLLRMVAGFIEPDAGEVRLAGADVRGVPAHRRDVNMVFQSYALFPHMSVGDNVGFGLRMQRVPPPERARRAAEALERVHLAGYERRDPRTLSGGEQQRVALARAIVTGPRVVLLDEPLGALDLKLRRGLQEELRRLQRELGTTFVHVTHDQEEALSLADRIAVMREGTIEQVGPPREVYEAPESRFVAGFVGEANLFDAQADGARARSACGVEAACAARGAVTLLLRPERIAIAARNGAEVELAAERVRRDGRLVDVLYHGASTRYIIDVGNGAAPLLVEEHGDDAPRGIRPGDAVALSWLASDVRVLER